MIRLFIDAPFAEMMELPLPKEELRHFKVLRIHPHEMIPLVNGRGQLAEALVLSSDRLVIKKVTNSPPPRYQSVIIQGLTESTHLDLLIEKGCELGVTHFYLFTAKKSKKTSLSPNKMERLHKILISALKQSHRLHLPQIAVFPSLKEVTPLPKNIFLADPQGERLSLLPSEDCGILVGPESGFTKEEIGFIETKLQAKKISLNDNILRTETASMISAYLLSQRS